MKSRPTTTLLISLFVLLIFGSSSCDLINPEEQIPSFLCIDSITVNSTGHGNSVNDIVDAWVFENEKLIGVYEMPAVVPILKSGDANIRIRPGVKLNGQAASRWRYEFLEDFVGTVALFEDSTVCINPTLAYKSGVQTPWTEDFESSQPTLTSTSITENTVDIVSGAEAFDNKSAKLSLQPGQSIFECKRNNAFENLPDAGASVILEFSYKCNHPFVVSIISQNQGGTVQTPVIQVNESEEWNHIYVSLIDIASGYSSADHTPVFGFVRNGTFEGEINVYLDNIKLTHF